ncbi:MAG: DUF3326 domain-containing protein [Nitrospinae bacterium]|nr:DUF3326 domain-containing protein [Nitrospinota bacterium]
MLLRELELELPIALDRQDSLAQIREAARFRFPANIAPLRLAITKSNNDHVSCAISSLETLSELGDFSDISIFDFEPRKHENTSRFNVVFLIPTGIGAEIGGHAGDATPAARLIAETCDTLILHPNVVNASDINEMPVNSLYVEGSVIARLLMGTIGLVPTRANRVLVIIDDHKDELFVNAAINAVSAARSSYGLVCPEVVKLSPPIRMRSEFTDFGTAAGEISGIERAFEVIEEHEGEYDAVAISSVISVPEEFHQGYFDAAGKMVNPWGGVEAMLTHAVSSRFNVPSAHSPMFETQDIANRDPGVVEPRMAAEAISLTFFESVLKGLHKSPRIVTDSSQLSEPGVISAADVSCLVIPDGCVGLPTLAALEQGIPVVAVRENKNLMENDLTMLPWRSDQLHIVENYWEAAGVLCAIRGGIAPESVRRPLEHTRVSTRVFKETEKEQLPTEQAKHFG